MSLSQSHLVSILHYLQTCLEDMSQSQSHLVSILHYLQTCLEDMHQSQSHLVSILHYLQTCLEYMSLSQSHLVSILHYLQTCLEDMSLSQCQSHLVSVLQVVSETRHSSSSCCILRARSDDSWTQHQVSQTARADWQKQCDTDTISIMAS